MSDQGDQSVVATGAGVHISGQSNIPISAPAHSLSVQDVVKQLGVDSVTGLSPQEASNRLATSGSNELDKKKGVQPIKIFIEQIFNAMTLVSSLLTAGVYRVVLSLTGILVRCCCLRLEQVSASRHGLKAASSVVSSS